MLINLISIVFDSRKRSKKCLVANSYLCDGYNTFTWFMIVCMYNML